METVTDLTSIFLELTQLNHLLTLKEESIFISSLIYLLQTPERFTYANIPQNVLKFLEHRYVICVPGELDTQERSIFDNDSLKCLDPSLHPGLLFLLFSPNSVINDWLSITLSSEKELITTTNLHLFRYTLEIIFIHLHTSKHIYNSAMQQSVISQFLSSHYLNTDQQNSHFFLSLTRIFKLFSKEALVLLLNSNKNGEVLIDYLIAALFTEHTDTYCSIIQCLITLLTKLNFLIWKYINDDLSLITNLIVSHCLLKTLEEWSSDSKLNDVIFLWCIPYFSSIKSETNAIKHSKIIFKWLSYLSNYSSSHPNHCYSEYTFLDIILETLPMPDFFSISPLACTVSRLFSQILILAFEERLLELLISTKEDWLPLFLAIRTAFFKEQSPTVQSQLSFKYFQKENRFNLTSSQQDSPSLEVFRMCHEFIVKVFNSGVEKSTASAESIVALCKQRQPINKVGTKIVCLLKELKSCYELEESKPSIIIDLVDDDDDYINDEGCDGRLSPDPSIEEVYSRDCVLDNLEEVDKPTDPVSNNFALSYAYEDKECDIDMDIFEEFDKQIDSDKDTNDSYGEIDWTGQEITSAIVTPSSSTKISPQAKPVSLLEGKNTPPDLLRVKLPIVKNGILSDKITVSNTCTSKVSAFQEKNQSELVNRKRKIDKIELDNTKRSPLIIKIDLKSLNRKYDGSTKQIMKQRNDSDARNSSGKKAMYKSNITKVSTPNLNKNTDSNVSPNDLLHTQVFDMSYIAPIISNDFSIEDDISEEDIEIVKNCIGEKSLTENSPSISTQDFARLEQDLYMSQVSIDENEASPIVFQKKPPKDKVTKSKYILKTPKRKKTTVTTMRPPFSRSRLSTLTDSTSDNDSNKIYKKSLYKNSDFKVPNQSKSVSSLKDNGNDYPANISLNLPDIDLEISPGKINRMNEAAKLDIQPKKIPIVRENSQITRPCKRNIIPSPSPKRVYTQHAQGTTIITNPTTKINPEEHIDKILTWSPNHFLKDACKPRAPPIPNVTPLSLSYSNYDDYKNMFTNFILHETWSNLEEEMEKMDSTYLDYTSTGQYSQQANMENHRYFLARLQFFTNPDNEMEAMEFIKEQDIVLMKIKPKEPDHDPNLRLFGYVTRVQVNRNIQAVDPASTQKNRGFSRVQLFLKYNTSHLSNHFQRASLKPIMSLTTYNRQWRGLINLYRSPICQYILSPNLRVCDPPRTSSVSKLKIPNENVFNDCQKLAIAKITSMVSEPYVCPRIALLLGPPGCGKSHTVTGCVQAILHAVSSDRSKQHILLCAPSNASADELAIKMLERGLIDTTHKFDKTIHQIIQMTMGIPVPSASSHEDNSRSTSGDKLSLIRLGQFDQVHPLIRSFHIDNLMQNARDESSYKAKAMLKDQEKLHCQLEGQIKQLETALQGLKMQHQMLPDKRAVTQDIRETEGTLREFQTKKSNTNREVNRLQDILHKGKIADARIKDSLLSNVNIILTTLSSSGISVMEETFKTSRLHFSCVIVDEATQCNELDILIPLQFMITKLVLVGDPNQLPAVVRSPILHGMGFDMSLFERFKLFFKDTCTKDNPIILLDKQYRMHPEICHFPNHAFYDGKLHTAHSVTMRTSTNLNPYLLFHISYGKETSTKPGQIINAKEIEFVSSLVRELLTKHPPSSIGIITPYIAQLKELTKIIHIYSDSIDIKTVDGFQGKEKDVIIISCVRSKSKTGTIGFLSNTKRINVAITRARKALYIVGDVDSLKRNQTWCKLIQDAESRERLLSIESRQVEETLKRIWLNESERI